MSKLITHIKRLALALCLATPIVSWAATTYSTDYSVTGSETAYTSSAGNANVYWQNFNFRAAVDKDNLEHGYYFFLKDGDTDIGETDVAVKLDSITLTWGNNTDSFGADDTPYLVVTTPDDNSPVIIGVSDAGDKRVANGTSTFPFSNVVLASNAKYRFYFYKNDVSSLSVGTVLTGAQQARINGRWHNTQGDARADYNDIRCSGGTGYSINCSFVVSPLEEGDAVVLETGDASIPLAAADTPVVVEGKVVDGAVDVGSEVAVDGVLTVCGEATTLVLTDSLTATAFYFPATVTIDASAVSGLDPTGDDSSKTTTLLSGALKYMTAPTVVLPAATAGMIYETNVTASGISVTVVKGVDCVETITANTVWSDIKPEGWIDSVVGDKPSIEITYEGEEPVTLTFDEVVTAGTLTLTGNIVVEASAAATFGTVTAGAGSVVEMANMTITTQSGSGVYRYRTGYPSTVPNQGLTYEYVGTDDSENPGTVNLNGMRGVVRTTGYMSITGYYPVNTGAKLDVVSGTTSLSAGSQGICGYITIREGATLKNLVTDSLAYSNYSSIIDIYGTLDMGTSRWTTWSGAAINLRGGEVVGVGEDNNGALDFMGTCNITAYADSTISGNVKFRNALSNVTVNDGVTLTISGATKPGYDGGGITKKGAGTLKFTSDPYVPGGIVVEAGTLAFDTESDVDPVVTYTAAVLKDANMDYVSASNWKGRVVVSAVAAGTTATQIALNKTGNENSYLTLNEISGNAWCAGSTYTVQPEITLEGDVNFENGSSKQAVTFRKIAAGTGNLSLKSWSTCTGITYGFTTLDADNYTGTIQLDGSVLTFNVGDILKANAQPGDKVLPLTVANNATVNLSGAKVNGESVGLELKEDGIYVAVPVTTVDITITPVTGATASVTADGQSVEIVDGKVTVDIGAEVSVTYTATAGYVVTDGTVVFTATADTTAVDTSNVKSDAIVAVITDANSDTWSYTDIATAFTEVEDGDTLTLYTDYTLTANVEVSASFVLAGNAGTETVSAGGYHFVVTDDAEFTIADSVTVGAQVWIASTTCKVKVPSTASTVVRNDSSLPMIDGYMLRYSTDDGVKTYWIIQQFVLNVNYSNCAAYLDAEHETPLGYTPVDDGSTVKFVVVPAEGYESPTVLANDTTVEPDNEGWYSVTVDGANVNIVVSATIKTLTLTVPEVANATATVTVSGVATEERTFDYGTVVTVTYTPATYYSVTANGEQEITMTEDKSAVEPTVVRNTVTVTVPSVKNATATATIGGDPVVLDANGQAVVSEGFVVTVTYTADAGYDLEGTAEYTINTATETTFTLDESTKATVHVAAALVSGGSETTYQTVVNAIYGLMACAGTDREAYVEVRDDTEPLDADSMAFLAGYSIIYDATANAYRFAVAVIPTGGATQNCYPTLDAALAAAEAGQTVRLYRDVVLTEKAKKFTLSKSITLDLGGRSIQRLTTNNYVLVIPNGFEVTIKDTSSAGTGFIKGTPVTATGKVASLIQVKGTLTLESGSLISDYNCVKVDEDPGVGTFVMNGGTLEIIGDYTGRTYALMNWGSATINDGTINGNLWALADNSNNASKEGTLVVNGGTFQTAVLKLYVADDDTKPTIKVATSVETVFTTEMSVKDGATVNWQLAEPTVSEGYTVYTLEQKPAGIDPTDPESKQEVAPTAEEIEAAGGDAAEAAKEAAEVTVPDAVSGAVESAAQTAGKTPEELYKSYFKLEAVETSEGSGVYNVTIADLKEEVKESVSKNAVEELVAAVEDTQADTVTVAVPAGLYYKVETFDTLGGEAVDTESGISTGTTAAVNKPTGTTRGFIRVTVGPAPIQ